MNYSFRIITVSFIMLCVTSASFAGMQKCYKRAPVLSSLSKKADWSDNHLPRLVVGWCGSPLVYINRTKEETVTYQYIKRVYNVPAFPFYRQHYSNPPFAPPRKLLPING